MKVGAIIRAFTCVLAASFPLMAFAGPAPDADNDTVPDVVDNCSMELGNGSPEGNKACQTDDDQDGYGNLCDADTNNNNVENAADAGGFSASLTAGTGVGDMNCNGVANAADAGQFVFRLGGGGGGGVPGPSGLSCAGTVPCN